MCSRTSHRVTIGDEAPENPCASDLLETARRALLILVRSTCCVLFGYQSDKVLIKTVHKNYGLTLPT